MLETPRCVLAECPVWDAAEGALYWTDIVGRAIWRYVPGGDGAAGRAECVWRGDRQVGGFALAEDGRLVVCSDRDVGLLEPATGGVEPIASWTVPLADDERFNDVVVDPAGRLLAGTLTERRVEGVLYRMESGRRPVVVLRGLRTSNGMAFSPDGAWFHHTDSRPGVITRYAYDVGSGRIGDPQVVYDSRRVDIPGRPDGLTIDREGNLWAACYGGGRVVCMDCNGGILGVVDVPAAHVTSVAFGGAGMTELYITTARSGDDPAEDLGGRLFRANVAAVGRVEPRVRV